MRCGGGVHKPVVSGERCTKLTCSVRRVLDLIGTILQVLIRLRLICAVLPSSSPGFHIHPRSLSLLSTAFRPTIIPRMSFLVAIIAFHIRTISYPVGSSSMVPGSRKHH